MVHIVVSGLTFIDIDETHKYHDFAGVQGWVLFAVKLCLWLYFSYCFIETRETISARKKSYLKLLFISGSSYLLAVPICMLATFMFAPYERQFVFDLLSHTFMFASNTFLLYSVSYSKSAYAKAALDALGILPGDFGPRD